MNSLKSKYRVQTAALFAGHLLAIWRGSADTCQVIDIGKYEAAFGEKIAHSVFLLFARHLLVIFRESSSPLNVAYRNAAYK